MSVNTEFLRRCLNTLEHALGELERSDPDDITYDIFRAACVKEFELVLAQSGELLRRRLRAWVASPQDRVSQCLLIFPRVIDIVSW